MLFTDLNLCEEIIKAVEDMGFTDTTEIQQKAIPIMLEGKDLVGKSNTGTGKTAAFGLPVVQGIKKGTKNGVQAIILCPTRELAMQACGELKKFAAYMPWVKPSAVYGGASMDRQITELRRGANIVVGTPGRVMDHIRRGTLILDGVRTVVLDEADEMLDMGFREDIETILQYVPEERQTALFSATMPPEILAITDKYQKNPIKISIASNARTVDSIEQYYFEVPMGRKTDALRMLLAAYEPRLAMVFCNTKRMVDELSESLIAKGIKAAGLHGDMKQAARTQVLDSFKSGRLNVLIATDVAARGIDVDDVDIVFNYDLPQDNEYYIHRIGRTGRAGKSGRAYTIISGRKQFYELKDTARFCKAEIIRKELPTKEDVAEKKISAALEETLRATENGGGEKYLPYIEKIMAQGFSAEAIAAAMLDMRLSEELNNLPKFTKSVVKEYKGKDGRGTVKTFKPEISAGRKNKLAPNFILGALVDATGMSGKFFGKIDIYDKFSTVEIPEEEREHVLDAMTGVKINGQRVTVKPYEGRKERLEDDRRRDRRKSYGKPRGDRSNSNRRNDRHYSARRKG